MGGFPEDTMPAAVITEHGGPEVVSVSEREVPVPGAGEVLVKVAACGLNRADLAQLYGLTGPGLRPVALPRITGGDIAGTIAALGSDVSGWAKGQRVVVYPGVFCGECSFCRQGEETMCDHYEIIGESMDGGLAGYVVVPAINLMAVPDGVDLVTVAAAPVAFTTAWRMLATAGQIQPADDVLIVGIGGGVATAAAAIARLFGARVFATTRNPAKVDRALALGIKDVLAGYNQPFDSWIKQRTGGYGVDIVIDSVGAPTWRQSINSLKMGGRLCICGATGGDTPEISIREIYQHHRSIMGAPCGNVREFQRVMQLVFRGELVPVIDRVFALDDIQEALRWLESADHFGNIVVQP